jgi:DegV family protein with EDD domain
MIRIVTDSTCDLPEEVVNQHDITVLALHINQGANSFRDGIDLSRDEFYTQLPDYDPPPSTAAPGPELFLQAYEQLANEGAQEILSIHISESLETVMHFIGHEQSF